MASLSDTLPPRSAATQAVFGYAKAGASALVLGAAFGVGLLFGGAGDDEGPRSEGTLLAAADASTEKLEAVQEKLRLVFHEELTGPPRDKPDGDPVTPKDAPKTAAPARAPTPAPAAPVVAAAGEEGTSGTEPEEVPVVEDKAAPAIAASAAASKVDAAPDEDEENLAAPPKAETEADRTRVARALAKVLGEAAPAAPKADAPAAAAFAVQIASTPSEEGAEALVTKLRAQGHDAALASVEIPGKGTMYRVRVGGFASRDDAAEYRAKLGEGFVISE